MGCLSRNPMHAIYHYGTTVKDAPSLMLIPYEFPSVEHCKAAANLGPYNLPEPAEGIFQKFNMDEIICVYTDGGFLSGEKLGSCGVSIRYRGNELISLHDLWFPCYSSTSAESVGIATGLSALASPREFDLPECRIIVIFCDSTAALYLLTRPARHPLRRTDPIILESLSYVAALQKEGFIVYICWVHGHSGLLGNERADEIASKALKDRSLLRTTDIAMDYFKQKARRLSSRPKHKIITPHIACLISDENGVVGRAIFRIMTRSTHLSDKWLDRTSRGGDPGYCPFCLSWTSSLDHLVSDCESTEAFEARQNLQSDLWSLNLGEVESMVGLLNNPLSWRPFLAFLTELNIKP